MKNIEYTKKSLIIVLAIFAILLLTGGTYAYWTWSSQINKNVVFNTLSGLEDYIIYDEGESHFVGNFQPTDTFCENVSNTISFKKTSEVSELNFLATIYMDINSIGENIASSSDVYWIVTEGNNTIDCSNGINSDLVLATGTFNGVTSGSTIKLLDRIEVLETKKQYTVWMWINSAGTDLSKLSGETIDANIWTEFMMVDSLEEEIIEINPVYSYSCANGSIGSEPYDITYTGDCEVIDDGDGNWRIRFLTSGTFTPKEKITIDTFLVGGGGGGGAATSSVHGGAGGGGGHIVNSYVNLYSGHEYDIYIGAGGTVGQNGEDTNAFGLTASGGSTASGSTGGGGGSGGGSGGDGGSGGSNGGGGSGNGGGTGSGLTTYEFQDTNLTLYSGGGGGAGTSGCSYDGVNLFCSCASKGAGGAGGGAEGNGGSALANTGGGGGGQGGLGCSNGDGIGGSGIVVIRNSRYGCEHGELPDVELTFTYSGICRIEDDGEGDFRIKFLTDGAFYSTIDRTLDAFLVGGGGGGSSEAPYITGGGGGGGGYVTNSSIDISKGVYYDIFIGAGGAASQPGGITTAFDLTANGGNPGVGANGGSGGSGGGVGGYGGGGGTAGGSNGSGGSGDGAGTGAGVITYEFGDTSLTMYAGGGGGGGGSGCTGSTAEDFWCNCGTAGQGGTSGGNGNGGSALDNSGGGGGGLGSLGCSNGSGSGGSGIVIVRNQR